MNTKQFQYVLTLAHEGSFSKAADTLNITQPSLSQYIKKIEHEVGKTYRVFHKHNTQVVLDEIVKWATEGVAQLGCSPCTLGVGVGRSHFEATSMMLQALADGKYYEQSEMEQEITRRVNESNIGPLGLRGDTSVIATFMKVGPQRASGVRIVSVRPTCCFEPRIAKVEL